MTSEARYFLNPEAVSVHLYCSICQEVFREPQRAPCGHSFCKSCIKRWLTEQKTCPEDRKALTLKQLHDDFILANIINDQMVACPFRVKGCEHVAKLEYLSVHKHGCIFNPANLPAFMMESPATTKSNPAPEDLPTPAKPSLKMRLFCDANKRDLLKSVFESNSLGPSSKKTKESTDNAWLSKSNVSKGKENILDNERDC